MESIPDLDQLKAALQSGAAVCLLGAGFARLGHDANGKPLPSTDELTSELKNALGIDETESASLSDLADFAHDDPSRSAKLRGILLSRLTVTSPSQAQVDLLHLPWRSIFTTNFDDLVERASPGKRFTPVTPLTEQATIPGNRTPLYHLHGRALDLLETDADPKIVISESNYLQLDKRNRDLYARLYNEVFCARAILVVGYSLKDLEIAQGLLSRSDVLREKTFIVCDPKDGSIARARLEKFGSVFPIGLTGIAEQLGDVSDSPITSISNFQFLKELSVTPHDRSVTVEDFTKLILRGHLEKAAYLSQIHDDTRDKFCVDRSAAITTVLDSADQFVRRFIVSSDFGNGKTVFLLQLALRAIERGYRSLVVNTKLPEAFSEIDQAIASGDRFLFVIDDVVRYREVATYIGSRANSNVTLVCTTRGEQDERAFSILTEELGGAVKHIDLNVLNNDEIRQWDEILERWGYWGSLIEQSSVGRREFIRKDCGSENRSLVLSLFRTSKLADTIDGIVNFFLRDKRQHLVPFAAMLIASLAQRHVRWESLVAWLEIDEDSLRRDLSSSEVANLFQGGRNWNAFTSSQLAEFILRTRFVATDRDVLVSTYSTIILRTAESANDSRSGMDSRENLKELMKFRFLTRLFGDDDEAVTLIGSVYKRLSAAPRIRDNPQFWLQYAMSRMEVDDLQSAESYLENALGLAKTKGKDYSPFQILDQRARLYLKKNNRKAKFNRTEIRTAIVDLSDLSRHKDYEFIYPFRAVPLIRDFLETHIDNIDDELKVSVSSFLDEMKATSEGVAKLPRAQKGETRVLLSALSEARLILRNA